MKSWLMTETAAGGRRPAPSFAWWLACLAPWFAACAATTSGPQLQHAPRDHDATVQALADAASRSDLAWSIVRSLTTEVGPRLAGTPAEARARDWAVRTLTQLGFANVRVEPFELDIWTRGDDLHETAEIVAPFPQPLYALSLGGAAATPPGGLEAEVAVFTDFDVLTTSPDEPDALAGRIVYVGGRMQAARDGSGYGPANRKRRTGWVEVQKRGAVGLLIRSVGTDDDRFPHAGMVGFPDAARPAIPALAVSAPDADQIERIHALGKTIRVRLHTSAGWRGAGSSGNVIAEVPGSVAPEEIVLLGAHLDSWDAGTGAIDDGAGVAIVTAAAGLIADLPERPRRTIRVVLFGAEEVGIRGAIAYARARAADGTLIDHMIGSESDFGAGPVWRVSSNVAPAALDTLDRLHRRLTPLGVDRGDNESSGGPDIAPLQRAGMPVFRLHQDGSDYFDHHHTPNDTLNRIDREALAQNVAAWAITAWHFANSDRNLRTTPSE